jgi:large subunit ribosomal protein L15
MLQLHNLESLTKKRKRIGRGGSRGGTSGRGHKGQKSRSGGKLSASFEGGQMPLSRRLPKRGFNNRFKKEFEIIGLKDLEEKFSAGDVVDREALVSKKMISNKKVLIKVLANGELTKKLTVCVDAFSKPAIELIQKAEGEAQLVKEIKRDSAAS